MPHAVEHPENGNQQDNNPNRQVNHISTQSEHYSNQDNGGNDGVHSPALSRWLDQPTSEEPFTGQQLRSDGGAEGGGSNGRIESGGRQT
ncbi:hypothetical protein CC78DRAFT_611250 [Lojkania enalia]|uniref:Uncharacterized protein n=1 Tax=Lojkania enalia TaxID=147567 RepID=A0A9P4TQU8_9PLEO|nr:hypothetical protein CC78DRAFT_611250 [Didymosphaeria enalia]